MKAWIAHQTKPLRRFLSLWLLLALFVCTGIGLVVINSTLMSEMMRGHFSEVCEGAGRAYDQGGPEGLSLFLSGATMGPGIRVHFLDAAGVDLATGETVAPPADRLITSDVVVHGRPFSCLVDRPLRRPAIPFGPVVWVLPFVCAVCCTVGAYVTWRMRKIESAVNHFGAGELAVRMTADPGDAIGRLAQAFNHMAERIESLVSSHQALCADMAHELRAPLTRLLMATSAARRGSAGALDRVETEAGRMNDLVSELLQVSRAEVDPTALNLERIELEELLIDVVGHCEIEAEERGSEIELALSTPGIIAGDLALVQRALENIVRNAVQHTPTGTQIQVHGTGDEHCATIVIRDWGPGVPASALADIFRPFYCVGGGRARTSGGTGLGLAIAHRAVALHGGVIRAENSEPGLRVTVQLPCAPSMNCEDL